MKNDHLSGLPEHMKDYDFDVDSIVKYLENQMKHTEQAYKDGKIKGNWHHATNNRYFMDMAIILKLKPKTKMSNQIKLM